MGFRFGCGNGHAGAWRCRGLFATAANAFADRRRVGVTQDEEREVTERGVGKSAERFAAKDTLVRQADSFRKERVRKERPFAEPGNERRPEGFDFEQALQLIRCG